MPAAANIVINDGAGSPVAHTFTPLGKDDKGVMFFEQTTPVPTNTLGAKRIGYSQSRSFNPKDQLTARSKQIWQIYVPTLETLGTNDAGFTPPPTVAYTNTNRNEFTLPERGAKQERKDLRSFSLNLHSNALFVSTIDDLQPVY
jgi:hypothetical protein